MVKARQRVSLICCVCVALVGVVRPAAAVESDEPGVSLSLAETLRTALANNLDLVSARVDPRISEQNLIVQKAAYDVNLSSNLTTSQSEQEVIFPFQFPETFDDRGRVGIRHKLPVGIDYTISMDAGRTEVAGLDLSLLDPDDPLQDFFEETLSIDYVAGLSMDVTVPLARGLGRETEQETLILAHREVEISHERLRADAHRVMEQVEGAYWEVVAGRAGVRIAKLSLQRAEELLEQNKRKVEAGTLPPIEITEAEAGVASQVERVIVAETTLENAEDDLLLLLATPEDSPMWESPIIPTDEPSFEPVEIDLDQAIRLALERRPEIINSRRVLANRELSERVARKRTRPSINLNARVRPYGNNFDVDAGSDGILGNEDDPLATVGTLGAAIREIPDFASYDWSVGLEIDYPIRNRAAKASYATAKLDHDKARIDLRNEEQSIRVDVRRAVRSVESGAKRVDAARLSVALQEKKLDAERRKFTNGMSTSFEVLSFQRDLADAELAQIRASLDYVKALTALERAQGTLLESRGLTLGE